MTPCKLYPMKGPFVLFGFPTHKQLAGDLPRQQLITQSVIGSASTSHEKLKRCSSPVELNVGG